ncbi:hypothetical protein WDZ16_01995 [Pseudokineococcus marinus]|uniref:Uncharacterized protein n=1 Tax=Pseudokineococcus marinus TaxID=351215 RepID=A0A849BUB5_9ACTN|nr:hypothetical protein [Pseudokineococcus marinus]NNH24412.1 hypothetical protein [Pseudokineococcus marinus]
MNQVFAMPGPAPAPARLFPAPDLPVPDLPGRRAGRVTAARRSSDRAGPRPDPSTPRPDLPIVAS